MGQLKLVTDANNVKHLFEYDVYGYFGTSTEGLLPNEWRLSIYPVGAVQGNDGIGRPTSGTGGMGDGNSSYDGAGNPSRQNCCVVVGDGGKARSYSWCWVENPNGDNQDDPPQPPTDKQPDPSIACGGCGSPNDYDDLGRSVGYRDEIGRTRGSSRCNTTIPSSA